MLSAHDAIAEGRAEAEALMTDWVTVTRPGGAVTDPVTGQVTFPETVVYEGKGKIQSSRIVTEDRLVGPALTVIENSHLHLPVGSPVAVDDEVTVVSETPMLGEHRYRLSGLIRKTYRTSDRWSIELVTR